MGITDIRVITVINDITDIMVITDIRDYAESSFSSVEEATEVVFFFTNFIFDFD